jgi:AcrR family transcriptional regulator
MDEVELPRAVALAWGVAANPQRGPKRELSIERIVEVAVQLADAGGLAAVSMSAIAGELGVTAMALYRYVTSKDDLLVLMQEEGIGVPPESVREAGEHGWRAGLEAWSAAMGGIYREHSWLLDVPVEGTPSTPNNLAWLEAALEVLAGVPLDGEQKTSVVLALIAQIRWEAHIFRGYLSSGDPEHVDSRTERLLQSLVGADELPQVRAALDAGVFSPERPSDPFAFGRGLVLDGMAALLEGRATESAAREIDPLAPEVARDPKVRDAIKARREVEKQLREARKREREAERSARERARRGDR